MEWQDVLGELVAFVKNAAPDVWVIMRQQVMIEAWQSKVWGYVMVGIAGFLLALTIGCVLRFNAIQGDRKWSTDGDGWIVGATVAAIFCATFIVIAIPMFMAAHMRMINPDYYVIKTLIGMITGN